MKRFPKRALSILLALIMLAVCVPSGLFTVSALPSNVTTVTETAPMTFEGTTKSWPIENAPSSMSWGATYSAQHFFSNGFHYAPDDAWITFDYDATYITENPNAKHADQHTVVLYLYYCTGSVGASDEELRGTVTPAFKNGEVRRTYTYNGKTYNDPKGGAVEEPDDWALSVPLGSKGTISVKLYDYDSWHGYNPNNDPNYVEPKVEKKIETNEICCLNIAQEAWFGNTVNGNVITLSNFRVTIDILSPPIAYPSSEVTRDDSGFLYTHQRVNDQTIRLYDGRYTADAVQAGNTDINFWTSGAKGSANAPSGSRLAIYFDTTAVESTGDVYLDTNCFTSLDLYVWDRTVNSGNGGWVPISTLTGTGEDDYTSNITTVFIREEDGVEKLRVNKNNKSYNNNPASGNWSIAASGWLFTLPSDARGYVIFTFKNPTKLRDLSSYKFGNDSYATASFNKTIYFGNAVVLPPTTVLGVDEGVGVTVNDTTMDITVDDLHNVKAGSLLVKDIDGTALSVPERVGKGNASAYNNTTDFTAATANEDVFIRYEEADTTSRPNFGYLGWQTNPAKGGLRSVFRFDITHHEGNAWYNIVKTTLGGKTVEVDSFGILLCTKNVYNRIGGANSMVTTCVDTSLYNTDFHDKRRRVDACAAYEDACFAMLELNKNDTRKGTAIYTRGYMVIDGVTYYSDIYYCSYDLSVKGSVAAATAI